MNARTEHRAQLAPLVESGADTWSTPDGRFVLVFSEIEPDTYVYLLHDNHTPNAQPVRCLTEYGAAATVRAMIAAEKPAITEAQGDVWVATCETRYQTIGVGLTREAARLAAAQKALQFLQDASATTPETDTAPKIAEYFTINATRVAIGGASFEGDR